MKLIHFDKKAGELKAVPENLEDLWHLERVLEEGDILEGKSLRRYKLEEGESGEKKAVSIQLAAEKIELARHANRLRVTGKIIAGYPEEFVQLGSYHTLDVELGRPVKIKKPAGWKEYQLRRLREAEAESRRPLLQIVVLDEEKATFAKLRGYGIEYEFEIENAAGGKRDEKREEKTRAYYGEIARKLSESPHRLVVAGPGFAKENLKKFLEEKYPDLAKRIRFASCSTAERSGVAELLKSGVLAEVVKEERVAREFELLEKLLSELRKESGLAVYGKEEVRRAGEYGALAELFVLDELLRRDREVEKLIEECEGKGARMTIFSSESDAGRQLASLGGLAGLLRFRIS
ncbi:MAG: mRNA surveillance protein pelota [Candidatus Micrarchaeia archaeon]